MIILVVGWWWNGNGFITATENALIIKYQDSKYFSLNTNTMYLSISLFFGDKGFY